MCACVCIEQEGLCKVPPAALKPSASTGSSNDALKCYILPSSEPARPYLKKYSLILM